MPSSILYGFSATELATLESHGTIRRVRAGDVISATSDALRTFDMVLDGQLVSRPSDAPYAVLNTLNVGAFFGEMGLLLSLIHI